ncbi:MAG: NAD(P)-dependent oxidoreductase [Amaricoccus sp.]
MRARVLFSAPPEWWPLYEGPLAAACAAEGVAVDFTTEAADPAAIDYIVYRPGGPVTDFTPFPRLKAVLSLWAGVETIAPDPTLAVPLCRMVDESLTAGMVEYVAGHVLRYHLGIDAQLAQQDGIWRNHVVPPLARDRKVGLLGLGALGGAVGVTLLGLGFALEGWSRRPREAAFPTHSGLDGLAALLRRSEILVTLLPATPATEGLLDAARLGLLPRGARIINPGRGSLVEDAALLAALDSGQIGHATLDVFRAEPLPPDHRYWAHPHVTVTPHIAAETRPDTASRAIAANLKRGETGQPFLNLVDRAHGY